MRLEPLKQWICDTCRQVISKPNDGMLEWLREDPRELREAGMDRVPIAHGFAIVHNPIASPRTVQHKEGCYRYGREGKFMHLAEYTGADGLARLIDFLGTRGPVDLEEFAEVVRRVQIPSYEEARQYSGQASEDGVIDGDLSELANCNQERLSALIERYRDRSVE